MKELNYAGVSLRIKAIVVDTIVLVIFMVLTTFILSQFQTVSDGVRMFAFIFIFLLYDPIFTSTFGGTIGHMMLGIKVKRESDENKNIPIHFAIIRYIIKAFLGIISLLTVSGNAKSKAIHDYIVGSVVLIDEETEN